MKTIRIILISLACACSVMAADRPATALRTGAHPGPSIAALDDDGPQIGIPDRAIALKAKRLAELRATPPISVAASRTIRVDCTKGQSIQAAVDKSSGPVVIEIHGMCTENVRISDRELTLSGTDPTLDGIIGAPMSGKTLAALELYNSSAVIENLAVVDSPKIGIGVWNSGINSMTNCIVAGSAGTGIHVSGGSYLLAYELAIEDGAGQGLRAQRSSVAYCEGCTLTNNQWAGVAATGGFLSLVGSTVTGLNGLLATDNSYADLDCISVLDYSCSMTATRRAAYAFESSSVYFGEVSGLEGSLVAYDRSTVYLIDSEQATLGLWPNGDPWSNDINEDSNLFVANGKITGATLVAYFGRLVAYQSSVIDGPVTCSAAGDAWLDPGVVITPDGSISDCAHAPAP